MKGERLAKELLKIAEELLGYCIDEPVWRGKKIGTNRKIAQLDKAIVDNILSSIDFRSEIRNNVSEEDIIEEFRKQFEQLVKLGILTEDEYDLLEDKLIVKVREEKEKFEKELAMVEPFISEEFEGEIEREHDFDEEIAESTPDIDEMEAENTMLAGEDFEDQKLKEEDYGLE
jgi:hypothetical protein